MERIGYLDHLAELLHCQCLSDLRYRSISTRDARLLLDEPELYPLGDYIDAARYLLGDTKRVFQTSAQARESVVEYLLAKH